VTRNDEIIWCDGCGAEITLSPVLEDGRKYCCHDCSQGIPCDCGDHMEFDEELRLVKETYSLADLA
jgi:hypothetical protein